ncbi:ferrous iron transporter B [Desulfonatronovibrio magnus]|uniref:ferrous iron transporter B n=1 Tax=Desulfonatronovibrio magnus TaxID=698827 RepID=UPI0005EAF9C1|nr:ferrous iron transporter B [Desulfonatronovibrio magnus]
MSKQNHVLLIGPPNVGKSVIFNQLTGLNVSCANYAGTTVDFVAGKARFAGIETNLVDVPGTYTLSATNQAEQVAVDMLRGERKEGSGAGCAHCQDDTEVCADDLSSRPSAVICVVDANNLESSLYLLLQVLEYKLPTIVALNRVDLARDKNIEINIDRLSSLLGVRFVPMVAIEKKGFNLLQEAVANTLHHPVEPQVSWTPGQTDLWSKAEKITREVTSQLKETVRSKRKIWGEKLIQPWPGLPLAFVILIIAFALIVGIGMQLRQLVLLPIFRGLIIPQIVSVVEALINPGVIRNIMVGEYGFLVKGIEWPFTLVMPYVLSFYGVMAVLEDSGYLPRLGVLLDGLLNKIGLQGSSIIPLLLGYGCGIPGILATRALSTGKERIMIATMICMAIPCISQTGAFIAMLSERSVTVVVAVFTVSFMALILAGIIMDRFMRGPRPLTIIEIPELLPPRLDVLSKKIWVRLKRYVTDGALPMVVAVGIAAVLYETGIMSAVGQLLSPLVVHWLRLPEEASIPLVLGIMRRELAVLPLIEMQLTTLQLFVGAVVGLFYVPCIAIVATLAREFNVRTAFIMLIFTSSTAFIVGGLFARMTFLTRIFV